ncbi:hypothetical protein V6N12_074935 [Hibiscus sabdariffa]|uniref:Uncharacterized protein n=1 Tax=Hibiscus sabdariffa TaxID=183260 RepID=A0ABR2AVZ1_9ROSI
MSQRVPRIIGSITWQLPACWDLRHREKYLLFSQKDPLASCDSGGPALPLPLLAQYSTLSLIPPDVRFFFLRMVTATKECKVCLTLRRWPPQDPTGQISHKG